jgi:hypothetical protein
MNIKQDSPPKGYWKQLHDAIPLIARLDTSPIALIKLSPADIPHFQFLLLEGAVESRPDGKIYLMDHYRKQYHLALKKAEQLRARLDQIF